MTKSYNLLCAVLGLQAIELADSKASLSDEQLEMIENHIADLGKKLEDRDAKIASLEERLAKMPAAVSPNVIDDNPRKSDDDGPDDLTDFCQTGSDAVALFNSLP